MHLRWYHFPVLLIAAIVTLGILFLGYATVEAYTKPVADYPYFWVLVEILVLMSIPLGVGAYLHSRAQLIRSLQDTLILGTDVQSRARATLELARLTGNYTAQVDRFRIRFSGDSFSIPAPAGLRRHVLAPPAVPVAPDPAPAVPDPAAHPAPAAPAPGGPVAP